MPLKRRSDVAQSASSLASDEPSCGISPISMAAVITASPLHSAARISRYFWFSEGPTSMIYYLVLSWVRHAIILLPLVVTPCGIVAGLIRLMMEIKGLLCVWILWLEPLRVPGPVESSIINMGVGARGGDNVPEIGLVKETQVCGNPESL